MNFITMFVLTVAVLSSICTSAGFSLIILCKLASEGDTDKRLVEIAKISALLFLSSVLFYSWLNANPRIL